jgi:hypothetical protein
MDSTVGKEASRAASFPPRRTCGSNKDKVERLGPSGSSGATHRRDALLSPEASGRAEEKLAFPRRLAAWGRGSVRLCEVRAEEDPSSPPSMEGLGARLYWVMVAVAMAETRTGPGPDWTVAAANAQSLWRRPSLLDDSAGGEEDLGAILSTPRRRKYGSSSLPNSSYL